MDHISSPIRFHFCHRLEKYTKTSNGIELLFSNGGKATCDLLVGADGVNSAVRKSFLDNGNGDPKHSLPKWTGTMVYRSLVEAESIKKDSPDHPGLQKPMVVCERILLSFETHYLPFFNSTAVKIRYLIPWIGLWLYCDSKFALAYCYVPDFTGQIY